MSSNMNKSSQTTKLRSNEMSKYHSQYRPNYDSQYRPKYDSGLQDDSIASGCLPISNSKIISEPRRNKCGGRGMAIQQLSESMSSKSIIKNTNLDFSNSNIERHFKNLKEENLKKLKEENEKIWGKFIHSNKNT
ncbi:uncharacterized protein LOC132918138 [Rhopalosiphum padi]|uniref:uncharacterized protein LOC132918138 n=1 Tax=Rhopalosiphum padi TaxID=40932 RepID=UPI00298E094C|nr:uncharacterized protein LOC132918138 [Rhopalosiphum padi]XP_060835234.1 uncharacterized protein LOC132918138 [Rhopalosiphum padi]XP_060835235.1 uncharacterized protein LOC132918138 [Rhopalosiphum padi]